MKILHVITDLKDGGAEAVLYRLVHATPCDTHRVICLGNGGKYADLFSKEGYSVDVLDIKSSLLGFIRAFRFKKIVDDFNPDAIQAHMYHANFFTGIYGCFFRSVPIFWGIHHTNLDKKADPNVTHIISKLCSKLSFNVPSSVICCGYKSKLVHLDSGYSEEKLTVVPNGYDTNSFKPILQDLNPIRNSIAGRKLDGIVLGAVARFAPQKDHNNLLLSLSALKNKGVKFTCLLVGIGLVKDNSELISKIVHLGLEDEIILLGQQSNINEIMNILDVHVTSSAFGEAFPNVICEAMSCGTPCITTDVGDAGYIVGDNGWVVPPSSPNALAGALAEAAANFETSDWFTRKANARKRICDNFSIERMARGYRKYWAQGEVL
ncbi:glycosyltransferase [Neptuniibacter sp. 2_MG-2023]|uniref:glycosyltransferase n=1 Tax=Neptuniibacter sp. 2_MG-2023 TaxID=3062671 RepID=UPI0026E17CA4|nr:glycosyltransferase [Neptuniibacter sp. 2_MG-2023]MDO6515536.1 glycosyltransferase [Neptuniibacter sp. 2_MG-2023]